MPIEIRCPITVHGVVIHRMNTLCCAGGHWGRGHEGVGRPAISRLRITFIVNVSATKERIAKVKTYPFSLTLS